MPDVSQSTEIAAWVQTGGWLAFASAVYWEIRQIRPWMIRIAKAMAVLMDRRSGVVDGEIVEYETPRHKRKRTITPAEEE